MLRTPYLDPTYDPPQRPELPVPPPEVEAALARLQMPGVATATVEEEIDGAAALQMLREDWMELGGIAGFKAAKIIAGLQKK